MGGHGRTRPPTTSLGVLIGLFMLIPMAPATDDASRPGTAGSFLEGHLLVTWYGNPHVPAMGILGSGTGAARADRLRRQAGAYQPLTSKPVAAAYHLVAVVAQPTAGADGTWRRRESTAVMGALLEEARREGFLLVLDVQPGRSPVAEELEYLRPFLSEPDVHLALDPEFDMSEGQVPGRELGHMHAAEVNAALDFLEEVVAAEGLPPKVLILHQFTLGMLPDKAAVRESPLVDVVLDMDGFGSQALKRSSYAAIMRQQRLEFAGIKLFYQQDANMMSPAQVMALVPSPAVVVYQ
jgi:hypothetical protein